MIKINGFKEFKKKIILKNTDPFKKEVTPFRDWKFIVIIFFVGIVASVCFSLYMSIEINRDNFFTAKSEVGEVAELNTQGLAKVLSLFSQREILFKNAQTEKLDVVDPSR